MADAINATKTAAKFESHPEGSFAARCVDTIDLGEKVSSFPGSPTKLLHRCAIVFRTGEVNTAGEPIDMAQEFTVSMHEKSTLRPFLERMRGKSYTEEQAEAGVPLDKLVNQPAFITVEHKTSQKGRTYAAIIGVAPVPKTLTVPEFSKYIRAPYWEERKTTYAQEAEAYKASINAPKPKAASAPADEDDLPIN
jgi:hypothetical protein